VAVFALGGMCGGFVGGWVANRLGRYVRIDRHRYWYIGIYNPHES
jgi:hypothetical protein